MPPVVFEVSTFVFWLRFSGEEGYLHRPRIFGLEELDEAVALVESQGWVTVFDGFVQHLPKEPEIPVFVGP